MNRPFAERPRNEFLGTKRFVGYLHSLAVRTGILLFYIDLIFSSTFQYCIKIAFTKINILFIKSLYCRVMFFSNNCQEISIFQFLHSNNAITE